MKPVEIVKHETYPQLYRLRYDDGVISEEFYNKTRAVDILKNYSLYVAAADRGSRMKNDMPRPSPEMAAGAFK